MSIRTLNDDVLRWFRCFFDNGPLFSSFTLGFKLYKQESNASSANKCLFQITTPSTGYQVGCYFKGDGKTVRMSEADGVTNAGADHPTLVEQGNWYDIELVGYLNAGVPTLRLYINGLFVDSTGFGNGQFGQFMFGNDYYDNIDVEIEDYYCVNVPLSASAVATLRAMAAPWATFNTSAVIAFGSCRGANYDAALATLTVGGAATVWGNGFSNHQGVLGAETYTYGPQVTGTAPLPLAYKSTWVLGGADGGSSPTTPTISPILPGDSRVDIRVLPNAPFVPQAGGNTDGRYQVDRQGNSSMLPTDAGAGGAVHSPQGITHPDGGWAFLRTQLNGKPRYYHRIGPGLTIFGNTFRSEYGSFGSVGEVELGDEKAFVFMTRFPSSFFQNGTPDCSFMDVHLEDENTNNHYTGPGPLGMIGNRNSISIYTRLGINTNWQDYSTRHTFTPIVDKEYWWSLQFKMNFTGSAYLKIGKAIDDGPVSEVHSGTYNFGADAQPSRCFVKEGIYDYTFPWQNLGDNKIERYSAGHILMDISAGSPSVTHENLINTLRFQTMVA